MKTRTRSLVLILAALVGCSGKKDKEAKLEPQGSAEPTPVEPPPTPRASQSPLPSLPELTLGADPKRAEKIALGHTLLFDKRLSGANDRACTSCHQNESGLGGHDPLAIGSGDKPLTRHAPVLWNVGYWRNALFWDGRAKTLEDAVKAAWGGPNMNAGPDNLDKKAASLVAVAGYKKLFDAAFPGTPIKGEQVISGLSEYLRTLVCKDTAYDKYAAGDKAALTDQQQQGLDLFLGKAKCGTCHAPPFFSTAMGVDGGVYFNIGIGTDGVPEDKVDVGRMTVTNVATDWAAFKPPSLRNISKSAPYFHNGSVAKLDDAVKLMAGGGIANKNKTPLLEDAKLTDAERANLVAFLGALDCPGQLDEPKLP